MIIQMEDKFQTLCNFGPMGMLLLMHYSFFSKLCTFLDAASSILLVVECECNFKLLDSQNEPIQVALDDLIHLWSMKFQIQKGK